MCYEYFEKYCHLNYDLKHLSHIASAEISRLQEQKDIKTVALMINSVKGVYTKNDLIKSQPFVN